MEDTKKGFNAPHVFDKDWPKELKTPIALLNETKQLFANIGFKEEFVLLQNKTGCFQFKLVVSIFGGHIKHEYTPGFTSTAKQVAKQNAALEFVRNPPSWVSDFAHGKMPEELNQYSHEELLELLKPKKSLKVEEIKDPENDSHPKPQSEGKSPKNLNHEENPQKLDGSPNASKDLDSKKDCDIKISGNSKEKEPYYDGWEFEDPKSNEKLKIDENIEKEIKNLIEEIKNPEMMLQEKPPMPDIADQTALESGAPEFSFRQFEEKRRQFPSKFIDVFENGSLIFHSLNPGDRYPVSGASVKIHFVGRRKSDGKIYENTLLNDPYEFKLMTGDALSCFDWAVRLMRIGEESLVLTNHIHAYGEIGHPPLFPPKESLLVYIKLVEAGDYVPSPNEEGLTIQNKINRAQEYNEVGNYFFKRQLFKLAVDHYFCGERIIHNKKKWTNLSEETLAQIKDIRSKLNRNIAAFYVEEREWDKVIFHCSQSLEDSPDCVSALIRRARAEAETERFEGYESDIKKAMELDPNNTEKEAIQRAKRRYNFKYAEYLENRKKFEVNIKNNLKKEQNNDGDTNQKEN